MSSNKKVEFNFINLLRAVAVLLVFFCHLSSWFDLNSKYWLPFKVLENDFFHPLAITQNGGALGVSLFFLVSGFLITHVAFLETRMEFALKRLARIYPVFFVCSLIFFILIYFFPTKSLYWTVVPVQANIMTFLNHISLWDYVRSDHLINYVTWTLLIEMLFYTFTFIFFKVLKTRPFLVVFLQLTLALIGILLTRIIPNVPFWEFAFALTYFAIIELGQIIYLLSRKLIRVRIGVLLLLYSFFVFILGNKFFSPENLRTDNSYLVSVMFAFLIFIILLLLDLKITVPKFLLFISKISYSLYLFHFPLVFILLDLTILHFQLHYSIAIAFTVSVIILISYLSYKFIEKPSQGFIRKFIHRRSNVVEDAF